MATNCYLDANICVAYIQKPHVFHAQSRQLLKDIRLKKLTPLVSPLCLDETIHILLRDGRQKKIPNYLSIARQQIARLLKIPNLAIVNPPENKTSQLKIFRLIKAYKLKTRDAYHLLTAKHHKIKYFATFDHDFDLVFSTKSLKQFTTFVLS
ncbi:type II toxin-antitoxin system VapC family toxin [Candidatus Amesbacteria bacterium]|nr:type II toxin-antitoxin system VapC family toxin [Candidatus Amesbacteria bacterium]